MKKLTAVLLSALMLIMAFPSTLYATTEKIITVDDAKDFASMEAGKRYILTQNIDLGSDWTTMDEFAGILDGNGYTITVPSNAPIFEKLSGTIENLNLTGTMMLDDDDVSDHYLGVFKSEYAIGVLANRAVGATVENVHSDVNVTFDQSSGDCRVMFGGMFGAAYPAFVYDAGARKVEALRNTTINKCSVAGTITADYAKSEGTLLIDSVGGLIALASCNVDVSNTHVSANIKVNRASGHIGGIFAVQYSREIPSSDEENSLFVPEIPSQQEAFDVPTITNCIVSGSISRIYDATCTTRFERSGGIVGFAQGVDIKACAYTGEKIEDPNGSARTIIGWGQPDRSEWYYIKIDSCVATLNNVKMISVTSNTQPFNNVIIWNSSSSSVINYKYDANISSESNETGIVEKRNQEEALTTFANNNSSAFSYENGTLSLKEIGAPTQDYSHKCDISTEVNGLLSTGMCSDSECNIITDAPYAGFIQYSEDGMKLRVVMVISENELEAAKDKTFIMNVNIDGKSMDIPDSSFTAYTSVDAEGKEYTASEGYYIFGVIFNFQSDMSSAKATVTITYEGEADPIFVGTAQK